MGVHPSGGGYANYSLLLRFSFSFQITSRTAPQFLMANPCNHSPATSGNPANVPQLDGSGIIESEPPATSRTAPSWTAPESSRANHQRPARPRPESSRANHQRPAERLPAGRQSDQRTAYRIRNGSPLELPSDHQQGKARILDGKSSRTAPQFLMANPCNHSPATSKTSGNPPHLTHGKAPKNSIQNGARHPIGRGEGFSNPF